MDTSMDLWSFFFTDLSIYCWVVWWWRHEKSYPIPEKKNLLVDASHMQAFNKETEHNGDSDIDVNLACVYWDVYRANGYAQWDPTCVEVPAVTNLRCPKWWSPTKSNRLTWHPTPRRVAATLHPFLWWRCEEQNSLLYKLFRNQEGNMQLQLWTLATSSLELSSELWQHLPEKVFSERQRMLCKSSKYANYANHQRMLL